MCHALLYALTFLALLLRIALALIRVDPPALTGTDPLKRQARGGKGIARYLFSDQPA